MLARNATSTVDEAPFDPDSLTVEQAYRALGLQQSARRAQIRRAYLKLALKRHPDRRGASEGGDAFRRLKAAYDRLLAHCQLEEELEELGVELEASERELAELETRRSDRELRERAIAEARELHARRLAEAKAGHARNQEDEARLRLARQADEEQWLAGASLSFQQFWNARGLYPSGYELHVHRAFTVRDYMAKFGPPPAVELRWRDRTQLCEFSPESRPNPWGWATVPVWKSADKKSVVIEPRPGPWNEVCWVLMEQKYSPIRGEWVVLFYWLRGSPFPFNTSEAAGKEYTWASWADTPAGRAIGLASWPVTASTLHWKQQRAVEERAARAAERAARDEERALEAEKQKAKPEEERREARRRELLEKKERVKREREEAQKEQKMAEARQLEYQDAEWRAWLQALAKERSERLGKLKGEKERQLEERLEEQRSKAEDLKKSKQERAAKEQQRSLVAAQRQRERRGREAAPPPQRAPRREEAPPDAAGGGTSGAVKVEAAAPAEVAPMEAAPAEAATGEAAGPSGLEGGGQGEAAAAGETAPAVKLEVSAPPPPPPPPPPAAAVLDKGTRLEVFWEEDGQWYPGQMATGRKSQWGRFLVHYDDGQRKWERLDEMTWRPLADGECAVKPESDSAVAILPQHPAPVTRSMHHDVKVRRAVP